MSDYLVQAHSVSKAFDGVPALTDGRLDLRPGEVHALCGGNGAGKSTFLNILMGLLVRDGGSVKIRGDEVQFGSSADAMAKRIAIITQELSPIRRMTVAENIFLGREPKRFGFVDHARMRMDAETLLSDLRFAVPATARMDTLSLAQVQLVEIARAISQDAQILIMDEPTSAIGQEEAHILFDAIRKLTSTGVGVIYVSHRLEELFEIATTYTVFRDGRFIESGLISEIDRKQLVHLIVGYEIETTGSQTEPVPLSSKTLLDVDNLTYEPKFSRVSLKVNQGEIVGLYGLMGAGRSELLNAIYGIAPRRSGTVALLGHALPPDRPDLSIRRGMTMVTEDRKESGLVLPGSIRSNIALSILPKLARMCFLRGGPEKRLSLDMFKRLSIRAASDKLAVGLLSGGNQQKVVIARCLASKPTMLICDEPTRGIDEGAKQEIYRLLENFAANGGAVLVCSSEAPEVLRLARRVLIMKKGRLVSEAVSANITQKSLLHAAS